MLFPSTATFNLLSPPLGLYCSCTINFLNLSFRSPSFLFLPFSCFIFRFPSFLSHSSTPSLFPFQTSPPFPFLFFSRHPLPSPPSFSLSFFPIRPFPFFLSTLHSIHFPFNSHLSSSFLKVWLTNSHVALSLILRSLTWTPTSALSFSQAWRCISSMEWH